MGRIRKRNNLTLAPITERMLETLEKDYRSKSRVVDNAVKYYYKMKKRRRLDG